MDKTSKPVRQEELKLAVAIACLKSSEAMENLGLCAHLDRCSSRQIRQMRNRVEECTKRVKSLHYLLIPYRQVTLTNFGQDYDMAWVPCYQCQKS